MNIEHSKWLSIEHPNSRTLGDIMMEQLNSTKFFFFFVWLHPAIHPTIQSYIISYDNNVHIIYWQLATSWYAFLAQLLNCSLFTIHHVHLVKKCFYCLGQCHLHFHFVKAAVWSVDLFYYYYFPRKSLFFSCFLLLLF